MLGRRPPGDDSQNTPDFIATLDQAITTQIEIGKSLGKYMQALLEAGFERGEAFALVRDCHAFIAGGEIAE